MKKIRDFKCSVCSQVFEQWVQDDVRGVECIYCGNNATRSLSAGRYLGNTTGRSPSLSSRKA